jgi:hypothetical protein
MQAPEHGGRPFVAAGAPWFMMLFGRDSLLTAWMALPLDVVPVGQMDSQQAAADAERNQAEQHRHGSGDDGGDAAARLSVPGSGPRRWQRWSVGGRAGPLRSQAGVETGGPLLFVGRNVAAGQGATHRDHLL